MQDKVSCGPGSRSPSFFFVISEVHGYGALSWVHYSGGVATSTAMVSDGNAPAAASNAARSPSYAPTPHVDFTGDLLHHTVLDHLLGTVVSLFVAVAALLVGAGVAAIKGLHGRWLGEIVVVRELHWAERGSALLHAAARGGLGTTVVLVDASRHGGWAPQLMVAIQLIWQLGHVWRQLLVAEGKQLIVGGIEDLLEATFVEARRPTDHYFLTGLLHLHQDGNDEQNQNHTSRDADYRAVRFWDLVKESVGRSLWGWRNKELLVKL